MAQGSWTGSASSAALLAADRNRDKVTIISSTTNTIALGLGTDAVAGEGVQLFAIGDSVTLRGHNARGVINVIGNNGAGSYQTGDLDVNLS